MAERQQDPDVEFQKLLEHALSSAGRYRAAEEAQARSEKLRADARELIRGSTELTSRLRARRRPLA